MAEQDIIQNLIYQLGQSQGDRLPKELQLPFVDVDERTTADLLEFTKAFAELVNFYENNSSTPSGNWINFFPAQSEIEQLLKSDRNDTPPHLALFLAFLELYKQPQSVINKITARHLDFYYHDVLRLTKKDAIADKVHVILELKKNVAPIEIQPENLFSAGKDATNIELVYAPTKKTIINAAKVQSLRSLFCNKNTILSAVIANSADGLGGKLAENAPQWFGFGNPNLPPAQVGFAIASPVLRMQEGTRKITISLQLNNIASLNHNILNDSFTVFITGEKNWFSPYTGSPTLIGNELVLDFTVSKTEQAVIDYNAAIHGYTYSVQAPIIQVLLKPNIDYNALKNSTLQTAKIAVVVSEITSLQLENDDGILNPKKAFLPFGFEPTVGSRFFVGNAEALAKKLSKISLQLKWKAAPPNFSVRYSNYKTQNINNSYFTASISFRDGVDSHPSIKLFNDTDASKINVLEFPVDQAAAPDTRSSFITFSLDKDFLHADYRKENVENSMKFSKESLEYSKKPVANPPPTAPNLTILNEPYTPEIQSITMGYEAHSDTVNISSTSLDDFANPDLNFFHITYFGQMLEHGYQRQQIELKIKAGLNQIVPLLPKYDNAGELLIGFSQLNAGDSVNVLFQVAEGSADPDLPSEKLDWFVLCDNYWKPMSQAEVVLDTTNQLLTSGTIQFVIPTEATTKNTILPSDLIWIKAAIRANVNSVCQVIDVVANAVEVEFVNNNNDPQHLLTALEPNEITKLQDGLSAIKTVKQPYASFGGRAVETDSTFYPRVSERLRHKNRCLTRWDYERIILEAFPKVHQVKCIPHAKENVWLAPGHVLIVVIPDLKNKNMANPLEPKVDADTISRITEYVKNRSGMQISIKVKNPSYQKVRVDFKVKFHLGYEFNYYKTKLDRAIIEFLSPWAYQSDRNLSFGGKIYKSVLLDFVEDLTYVDYVTDFKMYSPIAKTTNYNDINEVQPFTPDAILVSDSAHTIAIAL
jgi:hypothetical protein